MRLNTIQDINENKNNLDLEVRVINIKKFLEFKHRVKKFIIWKLYLSDYSGNAIFFCDEKLITDKTKMFHASNIKLIFHRGKKKFILRKLSPKNKFIERKPILSTFKSNLSIIEHKLI